MSILWDLKGDKSGPWNRNIIADGFYIDEDGDLFSVREMGQRLTRDVLASVNIVELAIVKMMQPVINCQ